MKVNSIKGLADIAIQVDNDNHKNIKYGNVSIIDFNSYLNKEKSAL